MTETEHFEFAIALLDRASKAAEAAKAAIATSEKHCQMYSDLKEVVDSLPGFVKKPILIDREDTVSPLRIPNDIDPEQLRRVLFAALNDIHDILADTP